MCMSVHVWEVFGEGFEVREHSESYMSSRQGSRLWAESGYSELYLFCSWNFFKEPTDNGGSSSPGLFFNHLFHKLSEIQIVSPDHSYQGIRKRKAADLTGARVEPRQSARSLIGLWKYNAFSKIFSCTDSIHVYAGFPSSPLFYLYLFYRLLNSIPVHWEVSFLNRYI